MKRLAACLLALLLGASGCTPGSEVQQSAHPALWEATGPNGQHAWLFGTIHALPDGTRWRTPAFEQAIAKSSLLMVEVADLENPDSAREAFEARAFSDGLPPLLQRVPPKDRPELVALLEQAGLGQRALDRTETWAAALQLGNAVRCANAANGVDRALMSEFGQVQAMESFTAQFDMFDHLAEDAQAQLLASVASDRDCNTQDARTEAWLSGDVTALEGALAEEFRGNMELREALVTRRNHWFAERIVRYQRLEPDVGLFVAVGAGHMVGTDGLPALLAARGYTVRRIQ